MKTHQTVTVHNRMEVALRRINEATVTSRIRAEELGRSDLNGGTPEALVARVEAAVVKIEEAARLLLGTVRSG